MRNIFIKRSYNIYRGETVSRPFSKKIKIEHISGSIVKSFIHFVSIVCQAQSYQNIETNLQATCFTSIVSSPLKLEGAGGVLVFELWTKSGVIKKLLRNRGLVERGWGLLRKRGVFKLFYQFSFRKACCHYYWIFYVW